LGHIVKGHRPGVDAAVYIRRAIQLAGASLKRDRAVSEEAVEADCYRIPSTNDQAAEDGRLAVHDWVGVRSAGTWLSSVSCWLQMRTSERTFKGSEMSDIPISLVAQIDFIKH
jgi:hypothetical protein